MPLGLSKLSDWIRSSLQRRVLPTQRLKSRRKILRLGGLVAGAVGLVASVLGIIESKLLDKGINALFGRSLASQPVQLEYDSSRISPDSQSAKMAARSHNASQNGSQPEESHKNNQDRYLVRDRAHPTKSTTGVSAFGISCSDLEMAGKFEASLPTSANEIERLTTGVFQSAFYVDGLFDRAWNGDFTAIDGLGLEDRFSELTLAKLEVKVSKSESLAGLVVTTGTLLVKNYIFGSSGWNYILTLEAKGLGSSPDHSKNDMLHKLTNRITDEFKSRKP